MTKQTVIKSVLCMIGGAALAYLVYPFPKAELAEKYFRAGAICGATVERAKPGLTPDQVVLTSRNYFASLGDDPLLSVPPTPLSKAERTLASTKAGKTVKPVVTNSVPETNSVSTNTP